MSNALPNFIRRHIAAHPVFTAADELAATRAVWAAREAAWAVVLSDTLARGHAASISSEPLKTALGCPETTAAQAARLDHDDETLRAAASRLPVQEAATARRHLAAMDRAIRHVEAHNLALVVSYVGRKFGAVIGGGHYSIGDLVGYGVIGLHTGVVRFDPDRGHRLSTFACWWIDHAVSRSIENTIQTIRLPVHMRTLIGKVRRATAALEKAGREVTDETVAEVLGIKAKQVAAALRAFEIGNPRSLDWALLDHKNEATGLSVGDLIIDHRDEARTDYAADRSDDRRTIDRAMSGLTDRERAVVEWRSGLDVDGEGETLPAIGEVLGLSRERVRQIEAAALVQMRRTMAAGVGAVC